MENAGEIDSREDEVLDKIREIVKESSDGKYVYRGQSNARHLVVSTLYREMVKKSKAIEGAKWLNVNRVQKEALAVARKFASEEFASEGYDNERMLSHIQHHAGDTNLIDFTRDYLVALFFACSQRYGKKGGKKGGRNGKVFLLEVTELENREKNRKKNREKNREIDGEIEMITPIRPLNRVIGQKSVFIQPRTGIIHKDMDGVTMKVVLIPRDLKQSILRYLETRHDISSYTIYNDLHGYIRNRKEHGNAIMEFYVGFSYGDKSNNAQSPEEKRDAASDAIRHYGNAIQLDPKFVNAYFNRGIAKINCGDGKRKLGDESGAITDYRNAISDCDKAIELDAEYMNAYYNRGIAKERLDDSDNIQQALSDLEKAKELALQQKKESMVGKAQRSIERVTAKIAGMGEA